MPGTEAIAASHLETTSRVDERGRTVPPLRPVWLRRVVTTFVVSVYFAALSVFVWSGISSITPLKEISVSVIPEGETVTETDVVPTPDAAPEVSPVPPVLAAPDPHDNPDLSDPAVPLEASQPITDLTLPPPKVESPDAIPLPQQSPQPPEPDVKNMLVALEQAKDKQRKKTEEAIRLASLRALKRAKAEMHARLLAARTQIGAPARHAGVRNGHGVGKMSNAAYAALVSAEINRHKYYPAAARAAGATGSVYVVFSIGSSGRIVSDTIVRSSDNDALDREVREMMAEAHPPPPPGGYFKGSISISFNMER